MAEQEELRLTVTVDDRASAQLQALRGQLSSMGGGAQAAGMERVRRQTGEVGQGFAGLSRELSSFATRAGVVGGVVGAVTSKLWELGASFISRVTDVKAYSEALLALHRNAQFAGTSAAQFQSNMDLMRESSGVGAEQAAAGLQKFGEVWVDLQRQNSQARRSLTQGLQGQDLQNMQNLLSQMARTDTTTAMNLYLDYADRIEQFWIDQGQAARGAQVRREFLARGGLEGVERGRRFTPVAPEDIAREETRKAAAKSYREDSEATATAYDRIVRSAASILMSSEGTGSATGIIKVNMLAAATAAETLEDNMRKAREAADKAAPQPGTTGKPGDEWWQRFNPFNPANIAREKAAREAAGLPTLQTPEAPAPGQQFRDRLDAFRQREKLQLPPETTPPPLNLIPRGPSAPVVRPPGAAAPFRIPPAAAVTPPPPSTAVTPPPSFAERFGDWSEPAVPQRFTSGVEAVGPAVGRFMPAPDFLAGREAGLGTAGGSIEDSRAIELQTTATQATTEEMQRLREAFEAFEFRHRLLQHQ